MNDETDSASMIPEPDFGLIEGIGGADTRAGLVTFVGRPNVGKSSLVNRICGAKVSIVSDKPQTTRHRVMGVYNHPATASAAPTAAGDLPGATQIVFVDTPGLHKPVSALGERVNATALDSVSDVDVTCLVLDATQAFGRGDQWVASHLDIADSFVVVNKVDRASPAQVLAMLTAASELGAAEYFPVSARSGDGVDALVAALAERMPPSPPLFPLDAISDQPEELRIAELVREQLLEATRDELPYSIATEVTEWEGNRIRVDIIVERESQKGMVIGKGGAVLKRAGERARAQLPEGTYLELRVKVMKNWQRRPDRVERLGY